MATAQKTENISRGPHPTSGPGSHPTSGSEHSAAGTVVQTVKDQAQEVMDSAAEMATQAKDKVQQLTSSVANQVKDTSQEFATAAVEKAEDLGKELTHMIRRYPIPALLVGFGVGLLLGKVLRI